MIKKLQERRRKSVKKEYASPSIDALEYAQFENVFTWCDKQMPRKGCNDITGTGNDADKPPWLHPSKSAAHCKLPGGGVELLS